MTNEKQALEALRHLTGQDEQHFCMNEDHGSAGILFRAQDGTVYVVVTDAQFAAYEPGEAHNVKVLGSHNGLTAFCDLEEGISDEGTFGTTHVRPKDLAMAFQPDGSIIIVDASVEIVKAIGHLAVIRVYANEVGKDGNTYYGDIFTSKEELLKEHPDCIVMEGYCVHDRLTGFSPDDSKYWYESVEEATAYIQSQAFPDGFSENAYIIVSGEGYWNNKDGWMFSLDGATYFEDNTSLNLPVGINVRWVPTAGLICSVEEK